jgi:hypothetical protein
VVYCEVVNEKDGPLGIAYLPNDKANATAGYAENQFTSHDMFDENHEPLVETTVQTLGTFIDDTPLKKLRLCEKIN